MVLVTDAVGLSFGNQLASLSDTTAAQWHWPSPEAGFALHVYATSGTQLPFDIVDADLLDECGQRLGEAPILAAAGYLLTAREADQQFQAAWSAGLARLAARQAFPRDRESFFYRPLELLGICLGLAASTGVNSDHRSWLADVVQNGPDHLKQADLWTHLLCAYAAQALGLAWHLPQLPRPQDCGIDDLAFLLWLQDAQPKLLQAAGAGELNREVEESLLLKTGLATLPRLNLARAAIVSIELKRLVERFIRSSVDQYWQSGKGARDAVELVTTLCSRFHLFALQLQKRHNGRQTIEFQDEYDVQDVLHGLLRLHFDDVRPEEWTPSYAGNASRTDFLLKSEQVIIETKVTSSKSRKLDQKEIANQLIIDKERYRIHPDCKALVCFVYDPEHRCDNVAALERDVSAQGPPLQVVVVVAPTGR